jgi:protein-tyrosine sulfotransferase
MSTDPIFILGICQRSGTNFLFDLLRLHPDCGAPSTNWEDFLVAKSDALVSYIQDVYSGWQRRGSGHEVEELLYEQLGKGLISVLASRVEEKRVVTKTPSVRNLENFFRLFPRAYLLILVRDGRAVVESRVKTFRESYDAAMRIWAEGADTIHRFAERWPASRCNYLIVRYEDLWNEPEQELRKIFGFVGLEADKYDFDAAVNLPVRGSSVFHGPRVKDVHWKPVEKTADFNPLSRSSNWSRSKQKRFIWIAGQQQEQLGYEDPDNKGQTLLSATWNKAMDIKWQLTELFRSTFKGSKNILKSVFGAERMSKARRTVLRFLKPQSN